MAGTSASSQMPPHSVFAAFGAIETPERMDGGRGLTWRSGRVVVRPTAGPEEASWKSEVLATIGGEGFTVPRPIPDSRGNWVHDGWQASEWIPGAADETRVRDIVRAGQAFHRAIAGLPRPSFIAAGNDPWSKADRVAWGEAALPADELLGLLVAEYRPVVDAPSQVIHGDLLGNVLFAQGCPPAIIDWAPYWRPPGFGAAIAVVDAACWHGYPHDALADDHGIPEWRQLLLRALVFRIATLHLLGRWDDSQVERHSPVAVAVIALTEH